MKIIEIRALRGPSYWSVRRTKLVVMTLDLEQLEDSPTNTIDGFYERLKQLLPSLHEHRCSEGRPGGFFYRVQTGTWMGHVIEHIALEIQALAGMECGFGRTRSTGDYGVYHVVFAYQQERAGLFAAQSAVNIAQALVEGRAYDLQADIAFLRQLDEQERLGPSTSAIVNACLRKGVPFIRLDSDSTVQLGYGACQKRIQATVSSQTSGLAIDLAANKQETKCRLSDANIPVPRGNVVRSENDLQHALRHLDFPLVVKPLNGNHGRGVTTNIQSVEALYTAFLLAKKQSEEVLVEQFVEGDDYRLLVIDYKLCAVAKRVPARVIGDGFSTIRQLVDQVNRGPGRGEGHVNLLTKIKLDEATLHLLAEYQLTVDSVLEAGQELALKKTANLSTGGTAIDMTAHVHPQIKALAERTARIIGLDICGIDLMARDITSPLRASGAMVIEVNAGPGLRMHTHPSEGQPQDVGKAIADMLFPGDNPGGIPLVAVTGTNGKTTTTRLTAHLFRQTGLQVGYTTTEGIYVGDDLLEEGDCTGPVSASKVLMDPTVEAAVLECARGGILRSGLAFDQCDVGIVTNVAEDHLGLKGIHSIEEMARVKSIIPETVKKKGYAVLNADNDHTYAMRDNLACHVALFSLNPESDRIRSHCANNGLAAVYEDGFITIRHRNWNVQVEHVSRIPLSFDGKALCMVENILAATLAAYCFNLPASKIAAGLRTFVPSPQNTPGRMNLFQFEQFSVMVDYAHNAHGLAALGNFIQQTGSSRKVGILTGVGDRRDHDLTLLGQVAAGIFDEIIIRLDDDTRGRDREQIVKLLQEGIQTVNRNIVIEVIPDERPG